MNKASILIVDDIPQNIQILGAVLKEEGYSIRVARNGLEALETIGKIRPDLIILDIMMPEMDGFETCRRLKKNPQTKDIPVLFLSAKGESHDKSTGFDIGAVDYITKPFEIAEIKARVRTHLSLRLTLQTLERQNIKLYDALETSNVAHKKHMDSMRYATTIQRSLLPNEEEIKTHIPDSFVIWEPKDIVGGDIYFMNFFENGFVIAVIDCTGHGIPGALMTMLAYSSLKKVIRDEGDNNPAKILKQLNAFVKTSLQQDTDFSHSDDGLDAAICFVRPNERFLAFAGARMPLYFIDNGKIDMIKGDRQSIGYKRSDLEFKFKNRIVNIEEGMTFYLATDGFTDQLGGEKMTPFGRKRFKHLIERIHQKPMDKQSDLLLKSFYKYKGENERTDDITVVGFRF